MSKARAQLTGFFGINGHAVYIEEGDVFEADHEFVLHRPDLFGIAPTVADELPAADEPPAADGPEADGTAAGEGGPLSTVNATPITRRPRKAAAKRV